MFQTRRGMRCCLVGLVMTALAAGLACGGAPSVDASRVFADPAAAQLAAAATDDADDVAALVKAGANPSAVGDKGTSLLQWALLNQSKAGFEALLTAGADPTHTDAVGDTVMHYAAKANDPAYLDMLLARGVDPNLPHGVTGVTPLMSALLGERHEHFRKLLAAGANPNLADRMGNAPAHVAARINESQHVIELLEAGANAAARNAQGATFQAYLNITPIDILSDEARRERERLLAWLREHGVPIEGAAEPR